MLVLSADGVLSGASEVGSTDELQALTFDGLIGWLHKPRGLVSDTGVLVVAGVGREASCAYAPMRVFADRLAGAGYPTLRFDFRGTGDSLDAEDEAADALPGWLAQIARASEELKARSGVTRVVLAGARLGATLAVLAGGAADGLVLLAPVPRGQAWLRRLRFAGALTSAPSPPGREEPLETGGYWLSPETVRSLTAIDLAEAPAPDAPVFVAAQNRQVAAYAEALANGGAVVRATDFPEFHKLFPDPATNLPPMQVFGRAVDWMGETFGPPTRASAAMAPAGEPELRPPGAVERVVSFGAGLRGVFCAPAAGSRDVPAVLFCGTGGDPRAGVGRFAALSARRLALQGVSSLRFDFVGSGDSPSPAHGERCHVYEVSREAEIDAAVSWLAGQGHRAVVSVGVCSGAYHALHAAWSNPSVAGVFAISPIKLVWRAGDTLTFGGGRFRAPLKRYVEGLLDPSSWGSALRKGVNPLDLGLVLANRAASRVIGWAGRRAAASPLSEMSRFLRRGGRAAFFMGDDDGSLEEMQTHFGPLTGGMFRSGEVSVEVVADLEHSLAFRESRQAAIDGLARWMATYPVGAANKRPARSVKAATVAVGASAQAPRTWGQA